MKDNTIYNIPNIECFYELEKSKFSKGYTKSTIKFLYNTFKENTYFYFPEDSNKYYLIGGEPVKNYKTKSFEEFNL